MKKMCNYLIVAICMIFGALRASDFEGSPRTRLSKPLELIILNGYVRYSFDSADYDLLTRSRKKIFKRLGEIMRAGLFEREGRREHIVGPKIYRCLQDAYKNTDIEYDRLCDAIHEFIARFQLVADGICIQHPKKVLCAVYLAVYLIVDRYSDDQSDEILKLVSILVDYLKTSFRLKST